MSGIGIKEAAFTGYPATDMAASRHFYGDLLGLKEGMVFEHEGAAHWVEFSIPGGHTVALAQARDEWQPSPHGGGLCFEVEDLEAAIATLEGAGVKFAMPLQEFPVCRMCLVLDPSGNTVALHQKKANHPECGH